MHKHVSKMMTMGLIATGVALSPLASVMIPALSTPAFAAEEGPHEAVKGFVQKVAERVIKVLNMPDTSLVKRQGAFQAIFTDVADVSRIASYVAGAGWKEASEGQQKAFTETFSKYMAFTYAKRFESYAGETVDIMRVTDSGKKGLIIQTKINRPAGAPPVLVDWQVKPDGDSFKVVDLVVEQASMSMTQRAEFQAILEKNNGSLEALRQDLEKRLP